MISKSIMHRWLASKVLYYFPFVKKEKIIMGIDPGTQLMGYGVLMEKGRELKVLDLGHIRFRRQDDAILRLKAIFDSSLSIIDKYLPDEMAVEAPFFGKNVQSMLKLGRAQGVIMAAAMNRNISITEYSPRKIKQSITGNGASSKEQVALMLEKTFKIKLEKSNLDATDGLAVALCHHYQGRGLSSGSKASTKSWDRFLKDNPHRSGS
jgi:crossover junction endodeoxyribonuclease RuvC